MCGRNSNAVTCNAITRMEKGDKVQHSDEKKLKGSGEYPLTGLQVLLELNREILLEIA